MRFKDRVCLVTGGASGIGKAICKQLAAEGGNVLIIDIQESGARIASEISRDTGSTILFQLTDISKYAEVEAAVNKAVEVWGKIDVLVNNAAIMTFKPILEF